MTRIVHEGDKCPRWPNCECVVQGYINFNERRDCGRKPKTRRKADLDEYP